MRTGLVYLVVLSVFPGCRLFDGAAHSRRSRSVRRVRRAVFVSPAGSGTGSPVVLTADVTQNRMEVAVGAGCIVAPDLGDR
jgi:hypothetical protein